MADSVLESQDKSEEVQSPSFFKFCMPYGTLFMFTLVGLGLTIFAQAKGNSDGATFSYRRLKKVS